MAEFAASILALGGVAISAIKIAESLRELSFRIKYAEKDIARFALDVEVFGTQVSWASNTLDRRLSNPIQFQAVEELKEHNLMGQMASQSKDTRRRIKGIKRKIQGVKSNYDFLTKCKWAMFNKTDIHEITPQMESLKSSLSLTINVLILDETLLKDQTPETIQETKILLKLIEDQATVLKHVKELYSERSPSGINNIRHPPAMVDLIDTLIEISTRIINDRALPVLDPQLQNQSSSTQNERSRPSSHNFPVSLSLGSPVGYTRNRSENRPGVIGSSQPSSQRLENPQPDPPVSPQQSSVTESRVTARERSAGRSLSFTPISSVPSRNSKGRSSVVGMQGDRQEVEYSIIRPMPSRIRLDKTHTFSTLKGYIKTSLGPKEITAAVDKDINLSIISETVAKRYDLEIDPLREDDKYPPVEVGDDWRGECLGNVSMQWIPEETSSNWFSIPCLVYSDYVQGPILGKDFLKKKKLYERAWRAERQQER